MPQMNIGWHEGKTFHIDADLIATGRTCILGSSGSGKSYAVGVVCEELLRSNVPFALFDPEGEHTGLKEKYQVILVGEDEQSDLKWMDVNMEQLAAHALDSAPLILDLSEADGPREKVQGILAGIYAEATKRRTPYLTIVEEADKFTPQVGERLPIFGEIARRGRKRGIGLMICSQRPSLVDKNVLSQCDGQLIGRLAIKNDLQAVAQFFPSRGLPKQLTTLTSGNFYALGSISPVPSLVRIRTRETSHGGTTPKLKERVTKDATVMIQQLRTVGQVVLGLEVLIPEEQVPALIRLGKSHLLFGEEETITDVSLTSVPLIEVGVRLRKGVLKKRFVIKHFLLDGISGRLASIGARLETKEGFEKILGLSAEEIRTLRNLEAEGDQSVIDLAAKLKLSREIVGSILRTLERKRLVTSRRVARQRVFRRLIDIPRIHLDDSEIGIGTTKGAGLPLRLREEDVREAVKGLYDGSEVETFRRFYYPLYRVGLRLKKKSRQVWIDGRTGRRVEMGELFRRETLGHRASPSFSLLKS